MPTVAGVGRLLKASLILPPQSVCHFIFSTNSCWNLLYAIVWLASPLIKNIFDSLIQYLANATFRTSLAFQMREEMMLEKHIFLHFVSQPGQIFLLHNLLLVFRAPENLKLAGNIPKMAPMCNLQDYWKFHIFVVFKLIFPITVVFIHLLLAFWPILRAISISGSSIRLVDTYF